MTVPMLQVSDLRGGYGPVDVLGGVSLEVPRGSVVALLGANGAGKTTAMRLISGLLKPAAGTILLDGQPVQGLPASRIARLGLAHAPEGRKVFGPLTTEDNLLLGAYTRLPRFLGFRRAAAADLEAAYARFPRLKERRRQLDEPSMGLAPVIVQEMYRAIVALKAEGTTLLLVEQFALTALVVADYAYVMERGQITMAGTPEDLGKNERVVEAYLG